MFRPMDFINRLPKGDECVIKCLAALAIICDERKVSSVAGVALPLQKRVLEDWRTGSVESVVVNKAPPSRQTSALGAITLTESPSSSSSPDVTLRILSKLEMLEANNSKLFISMSQIASQMDRFDAALKRQNLAVERLSQQLVTAVDAMVQKMSDIERNQRENKSIKRTSWEASSIKAAESDSAEMTGSSMTNLAAASAKPAVNLNSMMFKKLPPELLSMNLPKQEIMRQTAIYEIIDTEKDYVSDLRTMVNVCYFEFGCTKV